MRCNNHRRTIALFTGSGLCLSLAVMPLLCSNPLTANRNVAGAVVTSPDASVKIAIAATVTVDAARTRQKLEGFGASTAFYQNWITAHPHKAEIYDALFKGLKLDILRLQNVYRPGKGPDFAAREQDIVEGARASLGRPIPILMTSWSPPAALKSNRSEKNGGTLAREDGRFVYGKFAAYWYDSLLAYRKIGIEPTYISIQNEPDYTADWESCLFKPTERRVDGVSYAGYDRAFAAVYNKIQMLPSPPKMMGPEPLGIGEGKVADFVDALNQTKKTEVYAVAHHLYSGGKHEDPDTFRTYLNGLRDTYPNQRKFQTEFGRGDGFQTAWLIHNCLVEEEANAYLYWAAVWPGEALITIDNPWKKTEWSHPNGYTLTGQYYAMKHYSYFTAPGYYRVETAVDNPGLKVSAYVSPDRSRMVIVALNTTTTDTAGLTLDLNGFPAGDVGSKDVVSRVYRTDLSSAFAHEKESFKDLGALGSDSRLILPPRSIVTVTVAAP